LCNVGAVMILRESVVDAVDASAVSADVRNELFRSAYSAVVQDYPRALKDLVS
jgi:hypothetical protein